MPPVESSAECTHAYLGIARCGCVPAIALDDGSNDLAQTVAEWIKFGRAVERLPVEEARERWVAECPHDPRWGRA